jgi:hypothetical protein
MVVGKRLPLDALSCGRLPIEVDGVMSLHPWQVPGHFHSFRKLVGAVKFSCGGENAPRNLLQWLSRGNWRSKLDRRDKR